MARDPVERAWINCADQARGPNVNQKENSPETLPLGCECMVGVRRFELLTSSVSERPYGTFASCPFMPRRVKRAGKKANHESAQYHFVTRTSGLACTPRALPRALACTGRPWVGYPTFMEIVALPAPGAAPPDRQFAGRCGGFGGAGWEGQKAGSTRRDRS